MTKLTKVAEKRKKAERIADNSSIVAPSRPFTQGSDSSSGDLKLKPGVETSLWKRPDFLRAAPKVT